MPPKQAARTSASAANGKTTSNKSHFLPPQRVTSTVRDTKPGEGEKPKESGAGGRPDKAAYDREQEAIKAEIEGLQAKLNEVRNQIAGAKGNGPLADKRKELRNELEVLRQDQVKNKSSRGRLLDQIKDTQESMSKKISELNSARGKLQLKTTAEVDAKIRSLEASVESGSMRIVEEKRALAEIQNLKKQRKQVDAFGTQQKAIDDDKAKIEELRRTLDDPVNKAVNDRWTDIKAELDKIGVEIAKQGEGRDKLFEQRNELSKSLDDAHARRKESTVVFKEANDRFYAKLQEDRQRRLERQRAERDAFEASKREEVHARMREEAAAPAYEREIEDCRTLVAYFGKLTGATSAASVPEPKLANGGGANGLPQLGEARQVEDSDFKGMVALKKKGKDEEDFFMGGGGKKGRKGAKKATPSGDLSTQALQLPLSTLTALLALGVPTPMTRNDIPGTIATLDEKREWYIENQDRTTKERVAEAEKKIAASEKKGRVSEDDAELSSSIHALEEVKAKLGEDSLPVDREGVAVETSIVDEKAHEVVPAAEEE